MKCTCIRRCQIRVNNKVLSFKKGEVRSFDECPTHFAPLENVEATETTKEVEAIEPNFLTHNAEELTELEWSFASAKRAIKEAFGITLKKGKGVSKADVIEQIIDARYRALDIDPNKVV